MAPLQSPIDPSTDSFKFEPHAVSRLDEEEEEEEEDLNRTLRPDQTSSLGSTSTSPFSNPNLNYQQNLRRQGSFTETPRPPHRLHSQSFSHASSTQNKNLRHKHFYSRSQSRSPNYFPAPGWSHSSGAPATAAALAETFAAFSFDAAPNPLPSTPEAISASSDSAATITAEPIVTSIPAASAASTATLAGVLQAGAQAAPPLGSGLVPVFGNNLDHPSLQQPASDSAPAPAPETAPDQTQAQTQSALSSPLPASQSLLRHQTSPLTQAPSTTSQGLHAAPTTDFTSISTTSTSDTLAATAATPFTNHPHAHSHSAHHQLFQNHNQPQSPSVSLLLSNRSASASHSRSYSNSHSHSRHSSLDNPLPLRSVHTPLHSQNQSIDFAFDDTIKSIASTTSSSSSSTSTTHTAATTSGSTGTTKASSAGYGHHRQTSIVHGIQHSRNGSLASTSSSPLSPQIIAAAGAALIADRMEEAQAAQAAAAAAAAASQNSQSHAHGMNQPPVLSPQAPSRPPTAGNGASATPSTHALVGGGPDANGLPQPRKLERRLSSKSRREHSYHPSHSSRHNAHGSQSVGDPMTEYARHVLSTTFIQQAEAKLNACLTDPNEPEPLIDQICGPGVDPVFDDAIRALGHIAAHRPKPVIDFMMLWRKNKSDSASEARAYLQHARNLPGSGAILMQPSMGIQRRNTEPVNHMFSVALNDAHHAAPARYEFIAQADRKATVSIYILCRILLEITRQSSVAAITPETEDKLEAIIFGQLKIAEPEQLVASPLKMANWNIFALLLGQMSDINFRNVTNRYLSDLDRSMRELTTKNPNSAAAREIEGKMELVLWGLKYLRIKRSPPEAWEQACDFLIAMGRLFKEAHGQRVKTAFCQVFDLLLRPIGATAQTSDFSHPKWGEVLGCISSRLAQMLPKPRHWSSAFPLTATMLCVSPTETFNSQWSQMVLPLQPKFKDRYTKSIALQVIARLVWTYLYRCVDTPANTTRKLDEVMKLVLTPAKRSIIASDSLISDPIILIIRIIGYKLPEYCIRHVIFPLVSAETFLSRKDIKVEQLDPDRIVVGIRAFLAIISDLEKGEAGCPEFPHYYPPPSALEKIPTSPTSSFSASIRIHAQYAQPPAAPKAREVTLTEPLDVNILDIQTRELYVHFCHVLSEIALLCDNTFGGQAALDEKFSSTGGPKTPMSETFNFSRREDHLTASEQKQTFYELLHVAIQALPRCLSPTAPFNRVIGLLCTGTAHVQPAIAEASAISLKAIAQQSHAQQVRMSFSRFIFNFDGRYSTMNDGGMLGPGHIENTLRLYVELLKAWIEEIRNKIQDHETAAAQAVAEAESNPLSPTPPEMKGLPPGLNSAWAEVDTVESHGLFFLSSQSRRVRHFAITVLKLIKEFDAVLGKVDPNVDRKDEERGSSRLIDIMERHADDIMRLDLDSLSVAERSRLQRGKQNGNSYSALLELCTSDDHVHYDSQLWVKVFPNLIRIVHERCPITVMIGSDVIFNRIAQMYPIICEMAEPPRVPYSGGSTDLGSSRTFGGPLGGPLSARTPQGQHDGIIEQWKLFLIFACSTMSDAESASSTATFQAGGHSQQGQGSHGTSLSHSHVRKGSASTQNTTSNSSSVGASGKGKQDSLFNARNLLKHLLPLLSATADRVRESVVVSLGNINVNLYRCLLEVLESSVRQCNEDARARIHQRTNSVVRHHPKTDLLRTSVTHVYRLTAHFLRPEYVAYTDEKIMENLVAYTKELKLFLMDGEVQLDWAFQTLRQHYCGLMEELFEGINRTTDPSRWMTFETRKSAFLLMEDWCGYSPAQAQIKSREDEMQRALIAKRQPHEQPALRSALEHEKRNLRNSALNAMASLCAGPISITTEGGAVLQFHPPRLMAWIDAVFNSGSDRMNAIGRRALKNLITHNAEFPSLLEHCLARCYLIDNVKVLECYFTVITEVLLDMPEYPHKPYKVLMLCLWTLGHDQATIRSRAAQLLRVFEASDADPGADETTLQVDGDAVSLPTTVVEAPSTDYDYSVISIADRTPTVFKQAQQQISSRLAHTHAGLAFFVFAEFALVFKEMTTPQQQRSLVAVVLPWLAAIELTDDATGGPSPASYAVLANLMEITVRAGDVIEDEVRALWLALVSGPTAAVNSNIILTFVMALCLERGEQNFVKYVKQIAVFLATPGNVVEFLLQYIAPKSMVPGEKKISVAPPPAADIEQYPYCADLSEVLPIGTKQAGFSLGQLSLILLTDLMVSGVSLAPENIPVLLQVVTVLWDHYTPVVQEHARSMLVHLIHAVFLLPYGSSVLFAPLRASAAALISDIRGNGSTVVWAYEDNNGNGRDGTHNVPPPMEDLAARVVPIFEAAFLGVKDAWARLSLTWATSCPVRHLACRSFQIFRCIFTGLDAGMLADMLARLSNTAADDDAEIQTFAMEILTTLTVLITKLEAEELLGLPQLFWTTCACLESINEAEFREALAILKQFLAKIDMGSATVQSILLEGRPEKWDSQFDGLAPLIYKGLRSSTCMAPTLDILNELVAMAAGPLVGDDSRLFYFVLGNLPRLLHALDEREPGSPMDLAPEVCSAISTMIASADDARHLALSAALHAYVAGSFPSAADFLSSIYPALADGFLPTLEFEMLVVLMGMLTNALPWVKLKTIDVLCVVLSSLDLRKPELAGHGPDLVSPVLRLLQTEYCMDALRVIDHSIALTMSIHTQPGYLDKAHLRMSMVPPGGARGLGREYARTPSLFGIPDAAGWAIPVPAKRAETTRANIHAAFYTCQAAVDARSTSSQPTSIQLTPPSADVAFTTDDFAYGFFSPPPDRTGTMLSEDGGAHAGSVMGDLVTKLDSLDDFFDDIDTSPRLSMPGDEPVPAGAQLYEETVLPMMQASRDGASFAGGFAVGAMNPGAFAPIGPSPLQQPQHQRPGTAGGLMPSSSTHGNGHGHFSAHARSVTSPSAAAGLHPSISMLHEITSDEEGGFVSEPDDERGRRPFAMSPTPHPGGTSTSVGPPATRMPGQHGRPMGRPALRRVHPSLGSRDIFMRSPPMPAMPPLPGFSGHANGGAEGRKVSQPANVFSPKRAQSPGGGNIGNPKGTEWTPGSGALTGLEDNVL